MKTTLQVFCDCYGWHGGTIHAAKRRFAVSCGRERARLLDSLLNNAGSLSDPYVAQWFCVHADDADRLEENAREYHRRAGE